MQHSKKNKKFDFQLAIPLGFKLFATKPNFVALGIALTFDTFCCGLISKNFERDKDYIDKRSLNMGVQRIVFSRILTLNRD